MKSIRGPSFSKTNVSTVIDFGMSWSHLSACGHTFLGKCHTSKRLGLLFLKNHRCPHDFNGFPMFSFQTPKNPEIQKSKNPKKQKSKNQKIKKSKKSKIQKLQKPQKPNFGSFQKSKKNQSLEACLHPALYIGVLLNMDIIPV